MSNQSKYNKIIIDEDNNSPISGNYMKLTVEQYYDIMHHTHNANDLLGGGNTSSDSGDIPADLEEKITDLKQSIVDINKNIDEMNTKLNKLLSSNINIYDFDATTDKIEEEEDIQ